MHLDKVHNERVDSTADFQALKGLDRIRTIQNIYDNAPELKRDAEGYAQVMYRNLHDAINSEKDRLQGNTAPRHFDGTPVGDVPKDVGIKYDKGKPDFSLLPEDALWALAEHYTKGAEKYAPRNWENGILYSRFYSASRRHMVAWFLGEDEDEEGFAHLPAAIFGLLNILALELRGMGDRWDDRPVYGPGELD